MNTIHQHIPGFITGIEPEESTFNSFKELMEINWIKAKINKDFYQFSLSKNLLMVEYDRGKNIMLLENLKIQII